MYATTNEFDHTKNDLKDVGSVIRPDMGKTATAVLPDPTDPVVASQVHENHIAQVVITSEPEGASLMMGALHPRASLYERPVNLQLAKKAHFEFRELMRKQGCKVCPVAHTTEQHAYYHSAYTCGRFSAAI